ncbi:MAG: hypothetical protein E7774_09950 [Bradyrhizobium sp.]|nr:MAG: hypothetical protein E7774_09950 [Bradyrhizobium sp.]
MKVTIDIDCTPLEARQFMGLPDVQPMQAAVMAEMEKRMIAEAAKFSPDGFLRAWFTESQNSAEWLRDMMRGVFAQAAVANREPPKD